MRADMDALPMKEDTGLPYAITKTTTDPSGQDVPVAHSCGHDMHVTWLMGTTRILAANNDKWRGTVMAVFQPAEETGEGARAMVEDGLVKRFPKPIVALAQHVLPLPAGRTAIRSGLLLSQGDSLRVTLFGRGGHGSSPQTTVDPVVMAAATVMRLQTVVSSEIGMTDAAVVSVGSVQAGSSPNIIPGEAVLQLNIRTLDEQVRDQVLASIKRIVNGEATTSGAPKPPTITMLGHFPGPSTTRMRHGRWRKPCGNVWEPNASGRLVLPRPVKTSRSSPTPGTSPRCTGSSEALTRRNTPKPKGAAA
jgi:amidohydrolase